MEENNGAQGTRNGTEDVDGIRSSIEANPDQAKEVAAVVVEAAPDKVEDIAAAIVQAAPDDKLKDLTASIVETASGDQVESIAAGIVQAAPNHKIEDFTAAIVGATPDEQVKDIAARVIKAAPNSVKHDVATEMLRTLPPIKEIADYQLVAARPEDVQLIAQAQVTKLEDYYNTALAQAKQSFRWALIAAGVGSAFFLFAVAVLLIQQATTVATISIVSGALVQVISGLNFYLYNRTTNQIVDFSARMDQTQRFLLANSICESLQDSKEKTRASLVSTIATLLPGPPDRSDT